jgi:hypothetical protein
MAKGSRIALGVALALLGIGLVMVDAWVFFLPGRVWLERDRVWGPASRLGILAVVLGMWVLIQGGSASAWVWGGSTQRRPDVAERRPSTTGLPVLIAISSVALAVVVFLLATTSPGTRNVLIVLIVLLGVGLAIGTAAVVAYRFRGPQLYPALALGAAAIPFTIPIPYVTELLLVVMLGLLAAVVRYTEDRLRPGPTRGWWGGQMFPVQFVLLGLLPALAILHWKYGG